MTFATSPDTQIKVEALALALRALPVGEVMPYAAAATACKEPDRGRLGALLVRARKSVEQAEGSRFATVHRIGIKRLAAEDMPGIGSHARARIGRIAKRQFHRLSGIRANMSAETQAQIDIQRSLLGAISEISKPSAAEKLQKRGDVTGPMVAAAVFQEMAA